MSVELRPDWLKLPSDVNQLDPQIWPSTLVRDTEGASSINSVPVVELAQKFGTPLYVVDKDVFFERAKQLKTAFEFAAEKYHTSVKIYYAGKSLLTSEIARWVDQLGMYLDVSTSGELAVALAGGISPDKLGLHGNNKSHVEIGKAVTIGLGAVVIDSEIEIERLASAAVAQDTVQAVRLRVNTGVHAHTHEYLATAREDQKFGIAISDVPSLVAKIRSHKHLKFLGLHSHIGSQIFSVEGFLENARRMVSLHAELSKDGQVPELNLGGGFGVKYTEADVPVPIEEIAEAIIATVASTCQSLSVAMPVLAFEPGRYISGPAGITIYNVGTVKDVELADGGFRKYVAIDGGMSDNLRTALYSADYSAALISRESDAEPVLSRVVGKHCESGDIVVRDTFLPADIYPNDLLAVATTGAYCFSLASNYNYVQRPAMVAVCKGKVELLVRAETESDLLSRDMKAHHD
jgi:diaminopimelate decarboxylase